MPDISEPNWIWFTRRANKTASNIIYFRVLGSDTIVLHTREAAIELLEHRWNTYSDRPQMIMARDLVSWNRMLGLADYSEGMKTIRRYMHNSISAKAMLDWREQQEQEAFRFFQKLLHSPEKGSLAHSTVCLLSVLPKVFLTEHQFCVVLPVRPLFG
ncbi:unnamed protein product [Rhizoctonia solani]|uniref:Uncharacterized protein n=1 Tax=Rhizoctonia solani TaxID=456999 RepID=A0A8H3DYM5_9AGAM|nr:unnamed protein product [Rhizoctonia solani]